MRKKLAALLLCSALLFPASVSAEVAGYEDTFNIYKQDNKTPYTFQINDEKNTAVTAVAKKDTVYISTKREAIRRRPDRKSDNLKTILLGTRLTRVAVCENGWSKVVYTDKKLGKLNGYVRTSALMDTSCRTAVNDTLKVIKDADILDYPGRKEGQVVGEVLELDEVRRTATINNVWSRISYKDDNGKNQIGYIPTNVLEGQGEIKEAKGSEKVTLVDGEEAGVLHKSKGKGVFAEAVDGVTASSEEVVNGVRVGTPVSISSDAVLKPLGTFKITHYCQCSICCGPWANGITSTGVTATTNRTIAVDPTQIPYGSKVVINGQVYVAEDCGGAIKNNCIDIYVASHEEGENKGVFYTDVYLLQ